MGADVVVTPTGRGGTAPLRATFLTGVIVLTLGSFALAIAMAPASGASPTRALTWLLFVGSSVHVAATGWFFTVPAVRAHMRSHRLRYISAPLALVAAGGVVAALLSPRHFAWLLLGFFAWQFFHFQKQNLGMAALTAVTEHAVGLSKSERRAITWTGVGGIVALVAKPSLLQVTVDVPWDAASWAGAAVFVVALVAGAAAWLRRPVTDRPWKLGVVYAQSLLFFLPVFLFDSPYAGVAGLTLAHGFQYLLIVGLVARGQPGGGGVSLAVLMNVALLGGLALNRASHLHDNGPGMRLVYGGYLGLVMAHFVIDAGLWRLRDEFPRAFLSSALPYLLGPVRR